MSTTVIDPQGDFRLKVLVLEEVKDDKGSVMQLKDQATFQISKDTLMKKSPVFQAALRQPSFRESQQDAYEMQGDSVISVEIWLREIHGQVPRIDVSLEEVWRVIKVCDQYDFPIDILNEWYARWYSVHPVARWMHGWHPAGKFEKNEDPRCLLFPSWRFDHAAAFLEITKFLVYNSRPPITETKPIGGWELHLPARIIRK